MKKRTLATICLVLFMFCMPSIAAFYVATDGSDNNDGSIEAPFATLQAARDAIRAVKKAPAKTDSYGKSDTDLTVYIRGGRYHITSTLELGLEDSGSATAPVVYCGYNNEKVILDGSLMVSTDGFTLIKDEATLSRFNPNGRGHIYASTITDAKEQLFLKDPDAQLTLNDQMMQQSRFPNSGFDYVETADVSGEELRVNGTFSDPKGASITIGGDFKGNWQSELARSQKARLRGYVSAAWFKETLNIHSVDSSGKIQLTDGSRYGLDRLAGMGDPRRAFFDNLLCEIDEPGEWYYDDIENKLYLWPYNNISAKSVLGVWAGPVMFSINGNYIRLENITMQCLGRGGTFVNITGSNDVIAGCTMRYSAPGATPFNVYEPARNSGLLSCDLYDNDGGGRLYSGICKNDLIEASNCFIENCHFTQVYSKSFYGKVVAVNGAGNIIKNNLMHNHNGQIVTLSGPDHLIEFNEVFNTGIEEGDGGSFYSGASFSSVNNTFKHNFWHHIMCIPKLYERAAVYSDDGDCFDNVIENVFYKAGTCFKMNGGAGHTANYNIMLNSRIGLNTLGTRKSSVESMYNNNMVYLDKRPLEFRKSAQMLRGMRDFGINGWQDTVSSSNWNEHVSPYWRKRYPVMDDLFNRWWAEKQMCKYSTFTGNIQYGNHYDINVGNKANTTGTIDLEDLSVFVDASVMNFKFVEPRHKWAPNIPFEKIGLYTDKYRKSAPDKDTYRKIVRDHWESMRSEALGEYDPKTINDRIYFNTGKILMNIKQ